MAGSDIKRIFPWTVMDSAGFKVRTEVRTSTIPDAGNGRFVMEDIPKGTIFFEAPVVSVKEFLSMAKGPGSTSAQNAVVRITGAEDLEAWVEHFVQAPEEMEEVRLKTSWFVGGLPSSLTDCGSVTYIFAHSQHGNHGTPGTYVKRIADGVMTAVATADIKAGDELLQDYMSFEILPEVTAWFEKMNLKDVKKIVQSLQLTN
mmetsp:Transcript_73871/g.175839  ORF Transcript_73871/g.175839 Transcript_73871/m.175839 type:complete len:202 (-) Transcript_73871:233-838(-)